MMGNFAFSACFFAVLLFHVESEDKVNRSNRLIGISHNLFASSVRIENSDRISIENLTYDGFGPDVRFWLGRGEIPTLGNGVILLDESGSSKKLHSYQNQDIVLSVPEGIDVDEFDMFGVWCVADEELIGFAFLDEETEINRSLVKIGSTAPEKYFTVVRGFEGKANSGQIQIFSNNTLLIQNLTFIIPQDDANPFQFRLGRGSNLTVQVEFKGGQDGFVFLNEDVTILLSNGLEIGYFDTLGIWSDSNQFLAKVQIQNNLTYLEFPPMSRLGHGLRTGPVYALNNKTFLIKDIHYDGRGPDAYFWVGNGTEGPNADGVPIPDENGSTGILKKYQGEDIILKLPDGLTMANIEYLGLWCIKFASNFGFTTINSNWNLTRNMGFAKTDYLELKPISSLAHGVSSGPVFILNESTIYINNLFYDGLGPDAYFWVGKGSNGPDPNGMRVPDETGSSSVLKQYAGVDVMIRLPGNITVRDIDYIGLWCVQYSHNFGFTSIPKDLGKVSAQPIHSGGQTVNMIQKCCPVGDVKTPKGCVTEDVSYLPAQLYEGNLSVFDNEPMENVLFYPFNYQPKCSSGMYSLEQNEFYLLSSGQILLPNEAAFQSKENYCMDVFKFPDGEWKMTAFLCFPDNQKPAFLNVIKAICINLSAFFLIITSLIFMCVESARDLRGYNVIGFSVSMAISFVFLSTAQIIHVNDDVCSTIGYIYQFFVVLNFTMLCLLNFETFYIVLNFGSSHHHVRRYIYVGIAIITPALLFLISYLIDSQIYLKQKVASGSNYDSCWLRSDKKVIFYYVPIIFSILLSIVFSVLTLWKIKLNDRNDDPCWRRIKTNVKNVYRSCYIILVLMAICWTTEVISYNFETNDGIWIATDILECLQGFFVFLVFVAHDPVIGILKAKWAQWFGKKDDPGMELNRSNMDREENAPFV